MKIRTIIATAVTGTILMAAGSSLAFGADWTCPRGYGDCTSYEYCTTHDHGDCDGHWSEEGDWVCPDGNHSYRRFRPILGFRQQTRTSRRKQAGRPGTSRQPWLRDAAQIIIY